VYEGEGKTGKVSCPGLRLCSNLLIYPEIRIATSTKKHIPIYECDITFTPAPTNSNPSQKIHVRAPFTRWFTADGYFIAKPFQQWLASEVPVVGAADPSNVVEEIGRGSETERVLNASGSQNALDILDQLKASGAKVSTGSGRRRKA